MAKGKYQRWLEPDGLTLITGWARNGLTEDQIAHNMGIALSTLNDWKNKFPDILEALKKGKEVVDLEVENALFRRAVGVSKYIEKPVKLRRVEYENGKRVLEEERVEMVQEEIYVPPDTTACIFWLKNRKPKEWRDKVENVNENHTTVDFSKLTTEQIKELLDDDV